MKKITRFLIITALIAGALAIQSSVRAQEGQITGGYGDMSVTSADARSNARFAVSSRAKRTNQKITLVKILKAEQQVVAGLNFRLCMRVRANGKLRTVTAVVYQNLRNRKSLSNWTSGGCG